MALQCIAARSENDCTGMGSAMKKAPLSSETLRPDVAERRRARADTRQSDMLERFIFTDETSRKTNLIKTTGWAPEGQASGRSCALWPLA